MDIDPFDLDALRLSPELQRRARTACSTSSRKWQRRFIKVPWVWADKLRTVNRVQSYRLALLLLYEHWRTDGRDIVLSNMALKAWGISPRSKSNALRELERLGFIRVERRHRHAPRVTILLDF
jgi:hypothetical protein